MPWTLQARTTPKRARLALAVGWCLLFQAGVCALLSLRLAQVASGPASVPGDRLLWILPLAAYLAGAVWMAMLVWGLLLRLRWVPLAHAFTALALAAGVVQVLLPGADLVLTLGLQAACFVSALPALGRTVRQWASRTLRDDWSSGEATTVPLPRT